MYIEKTTVMLDCKLIQTYATTKGNETIRQEETFLYKRRDHEYCIGEECDPIGFKCYNHIRLI